VTKNLKISPEEAARLIKQNGESELLTAEEIASGLRDHVEEFGPNELHDRRHHVHRLGRGRALSFPGFNLPRWGGILRGRIVTDKQDEDSTVEAALALVEVLEPEYAERLAEALVETVPGMAERLTGRVLEDLCEEIVRREDSTHSHSIVELITNIQNDWSQEYDRGEHEDGDHRAGPAASPRQHPQGGGHEPLQARDQPRRPQGC